MSITTTETVSVSREALLDAIGWLSAADRVFVALNANVDSGPGELFSNVATDLLSAAFSPIPEGDEEYESHPAIVETWARGFEHAAAVLKALRKTRELVKPHDAWDLGEHEVRCER